jgi:hypothetical protein
MPVARKAPPIARGFVYVLLLVVCTVTAAYGGYVVGSRSAPAEDTIATDRDVAVKIAVARAVAAQKHEDRAKRREALREFADFQRQRFAAEKQRALDAQHIEDGEAAARAYSRGKKAGAVDAQRKFAEEAADAEAATASTAATTGQTAAADAGDEDANP